MFPPIRRPLSSSSSSSSLSASLLSRLSSIASSSSPVLLCVGLIALLFVFVTAASYIPSVLSARGGGGGGGEGGGPSTPPLSSPQLSPRRSSPSPSVPSPSPSPRSIAAILQWERSPSSPSDAPEGGKAPPLVPPGGAPLRSPSLSPPLSRPSPVLPQAPPPPPPPPPSPPKVISPHHQVDIPGEKKAGGGQGGGGGEEGLWSPRATAIKAAFVHAYSHYESKCFGQDEYRPLSGQCYNWIGAGLTIIDALPTMAVMGLTGELDRAVQWVVKDLRLDQNMMTSFFETTIRVLGGLVSIYDLTGGRHAGLLEKAQLLGDRLLPVFNTPTGLPFAQINLATGATAALSWTGGSSLLAELGTCQMEFFALSQRLGEDKYAKKSQKPIDVIDASKPAIPGLYPIYISPTHGGFTNNKIAWGAMGDSFYEYLLMYLLTGKQHDQYKRMYLQSIDSMLTHLYSHTPKGTAYIADLDNGAKEHKMDHLVCFAPGLLALGVKHGVVENPIKAERHMTVAKELMKTCYDMYHLQQPSGIGAEYSRFTPEMTPGHDASYKLRPETVESLFVLWRVTGDQMYRDWGWEIWQNIDKHCRVAGGYAALMDVRSPERKEDKMESFFLAETLKYLYLLFSPNTLIPIFPTPEQPEFYVFNTECHPLKAWKSWPI